MSYPEFLLQPYNLGFLASGVLGVGLLVANRWADRDLFLLSAGLISLSVVGLTLNGAIHDLGLGDPAGRFPLVVALSAVLAAGATVAARWVRNRYFPPVDAVHFNEPGLEGVTARVVSREVDDEPGSGRAQWHDGDGGLHLVACHTRGGTVGFGSQVVLERFEEDRGSYLVRAE